MTLDGLRSTANLSNFTFPDSDNLPTWRQKQKQYGGRQQSATSPTSESKSTSKSKSKSAKSTSCHRCCAWNLDGVPCSGEVYNPGTKEGASIFKLKTKNNLEEILELVKASAPEFWRTLQAKESTFGRIVSRVPIEYNITGAVTKSGNMIVE